jgi:hypothetical protein
MSDWLLGLLLVTLVIALCCCNAYFEELERDHIAALRRGGIEFDVVIGAAAEEGGEAGAEEGREEGGI